MIGFSFNASPPIAAKTVAGKFGRFWQVVFDVPRSMTSQLSVFGASPPQMRSLERPLKK
jgi:hypothetical protein